MKKVVFIFMLLFLVIEQVPVFQQYIENEVESTLRKQSAVVEIKELGSIRNADEFDNVIRTYTEQKNAFVLSIGYTRQSHSESTIELFCSGTNIPSFLSDRGLTCQKIEHIYQTKKPISSKSDDFSMFSTQRECKIYPFSGLKDKSLAREYYIYPASASADFQSYLSSEFDISFFSTDERIVLDETDTNQIAITAILMIAFLVFWAFWIVNEYQLNAVKKLNGYSDRQCRKNLFLRLLAVTVAAFAGSLALGFAFCGFYNRWSCYGSLLLDILKSIVPVLAILLILSAVFLFIFYSGDVKYALKGRKPFFALGACASVLKVVVILFLCSSCATIQTSVKQSHEILRQEARFEQMSSYRFTEMRIQSTSNSYLSEYEKKCKDFFAATDGVLINDENVLNARISNGDSQADPARDHTVYINANYLKINPIYDVDGRPVQIDEDSLAENETIVLVPQKYRKDAQQIYAIFHEWYQFARYVTDGGANTGAKELPVKVTLRFVRDNQIYFAYNTERGAFAYNDIQDPFAVIVTKKNMDTSAYEFHITNGQYYLKDSPEQSSDQLLSIAKNCGLDNDLVNMPTIYSAIDILMQTYRTMLHQSIMILALSLCIIVCICLYLIKNYMEANRKLIFVKKMLGYRFINIYALFLSANLLAEFILLTILKIALRMSLPLWLPICIGFICFDLFLTLLFAFIYQKSLTKNALKGDGI